MTATDTGIVGAATGDVSGRAVAVHLVIPSLHVADATGSHTVQARDALRRAGYLSEIFADHVDAPLADQAHPVDQLDRHTVAGRTALVYQLSVGSTLVDTLLARPEPLLVNYHNLTPASFFWQWAPAWLHAVATGRSQLYQLASRVVHAIADSEFNQRDLVAAGYRSTAVVPPLVDVATLVARDGAGSAGTAGSAGATRSDAGPERGTRWLFVGKVLPHKGAHHVVQAFAAYRGAFDPAARLSLVGGTPIPAYADAIHAYTVDLGVSDAVEVTGPVSDAVLARHYAAADVFVCLSAHEGFCFPLLEAMGHDLPVVALDAGAVASTVGDAGVVLRRASPTLVAAAVHRVESDLQLRQALVARGRGRLARFDVARTGRAFVDEVAGALGDRQVAG